MIDVITKYQASIFVNASDITPSPDNITTLINTFRDKEFIPNTFHEISLLSPAPQVRLRLSSSNNEWNILFASQRIDVEKNPTEPKGSNLGALSEFCLDITGFVERILKKFPKRSNRLSLITNFLLEEMVPSTLSNVYLRLFKPPLFYAENRPFEWNWRAVSRIPIDLEDLKENLNVITMINRIKGDFRIKDEIKPFEIKPFDRIQLSFDINTIQENREYRFELCHIESFYDQVQKLHNNLLSEITEFINE